MGSYAAIPTEALLPRSSLYYARHIHYDSKLQSILQAAIFIF